MLNHILIGAGRAAGGSSPFRTSGLIVNRFSRALPFDTPFGHLTPAEKPER